LRLLQASKRVEEEITQRRTIEKDLFNALNEVFDLQTQLGVWTILMSLCSLRLNPGDFLPWILILQQSGAFRTLFFHAFVHCNHPRLSRWMLAGAGTSADWKRPARNLCACGSAMSSSSLGLLSRPVTI
jgi:hypothetical protein